MNDYLNEFEAGRRPEYVIPLDKWFSMIIYPSLAIKVKAEKDEEIQNLINNIKRTQQFNEKEIDVSMCSSSSLEEYSMPIQMDLDVCRNF